MRVFVFGAEGQIARSLRETATRHRDIEIGHSAHADVDIRRADLVEKALDEFSPGIVVNPAAYTAVDKAEAEPEPAFAINRDGAGIVAAAAKRRGIPVIHLSTDYVFDGSKDGGYVETDPVDPQGVYGRSKLAGEHAVAEANDRHIILRTSWIYAAFGNNFVRTMIRLSAGGKPLRVVDDQIGCPTYAPDVADAILTIAGRIEIGGMGPALRRRDPPGRPRCGHLVPICAHDCRCGADDRRRPRRGRSHCDRGLSDRSTPAAQFATLLR